MKNEKDEAIAEKIMSLANEDEDKHDKPEDAQSQATPSTKTEGDMVKAALAAAAIENSDDSPPLKVSAEDGLKHDKVEDAQSPAVEKEGDDEKAEPAVAVEKTDDSAALEAVAVVVADDPKEKELIPGSQAIGVAEPVHDAAKLQQGEPPSTEPNAEEAPQQLEKELAETDEEKQPKTADIPEAETIAKSVETTENEKSSNVAETNPMIESEAEVMKPAEILETSVQKEEKPEPEPEREPEPVVTEVQGKTEEPEKESQEKSDEAAEKPSTVAIAEPSAEANEKQNDTIEEKTTAEVLKETTNHEVEPTETGEAAEPVVTEVVENQKEPEKQSMERTEEEKQNTSAETSDVAIEEKTREPESEAEVLKENNNNEAGPIETEKAEPVVTKVDENQSEPEKQSFKQEEEEAVPTETEKAEPVLTKVDESQSEPEKQSFKQEEEEKPKTEAESQEQPGDTVEVHPPKDSDIEVVKENGNSEPEALPVKEEKPDPLSTEVEEKPRELLQVGEEVVETSKEAETKQETDKSEGSQDGTIKDPISFKDEKTDKEEETNATVNTPQEVSLNEEAQAAPANLVEPSPEVEEKVVEEDGKKESSLTDVKLEGVSSKEVAGVIQNPEQASTDQEAKAGLKEERESLVPTGVEEKVAVAAKEDDKKEPEAADTVQESSREEEVEIKKTEELDEAKAATTEAEDSPAVDNKKEGDTDTKVDEISTSVREPVRETLASKFEEKEEEESIKTEEPVKTEVEATKESDATKTSKDLPKETPAKPVQKQSNNIISKVKQSLVKAKKAITGKSPSSKNLSSEAKGDIKVK